MIQFSQALSGMIGLVVFGILLWVAWTDFWHLKIHNRVILILIGLWVIWTAGTGFVSAIGDLGTAIILFLLGLVMWLLRLMGAGDVKLYFALGLFLGIGHLGSFAILLLIVTGLFLAAMTLLGRTDSSVALFRRLAEIKTHGKAPYGVIICLAALPLITTRLIA